jgi:hypothetical protein
VEGRRRGRESMFLNNGYVSNSVDYMFRFPDITNLINIC